MSRESFEIKREIPNASTIEAFPRNIFNMKELSISTMSSFSDAMSEVLDA